MKNALTKHYQGGKSVIQLFQYPDDDQLSEDVKLLWETYQKQPFLVFDQGLDWDEFIARLRQYANDVDLMLIKQEKEKNHQVLNGIIILEHDEWRYEPHVVYFEWASNADVVRCTKAFFEMVNESDEIGICEIFSFKETTALFDKMCEYGLLKAAGKRQLDGRPEEYLYVTYGKKQRTENYSGTLYTQAQ